MAELGDAWVVFELFVFFPVGFVFWVFEGFLEGFVSVFDHGAEFEEAEFAAVEADAVLDEEDGAKVAS